MPADAVWRSASAFFTRSIVAGGTIVVVVDGGRGRGPVAGTLDAVASAFARASWASASCCSAAATAPWASPTAVTG